MDHLMNATVFRRWGYATLLAALAVLPITIAGLNLFFTFSVICWLLDKIITRRPLCPQTSILILFALFFISSSVSAFYSGYPTLSFMGLIKVLKYCVWALLFMDYIKTIQDFRRISLILLAGFVVVTINGLVQLLWGRDLINDFPPLKFNQGWRLTSSFRSYGLLGTYLMALAPLIAMFLFEKRTASKAFKPLLVMAALAGACVLYLTHSRGAWLASVVGMSIFLVLTRHKWLLAALFTAAVAAILLLPRGTILHLDHFNRESSLVERNLLWSRAIQVIQARPLFGCGINTYVHNYPKYNQDKEWRLFKWEIPKEYIPMMNKTWRVPGYYTQNPTYYAHNGYLQLAAESGLISLALFLVILFSALRAGWWQLRLADGLRMPAAALLAGFVGLLVHALIDTTLHNLQSSFLIWFFIGALVALGRLSSEGAVIVKKDGRKGPIGTGPDPARERIETSRRP